MFDVDQNSDQVRRWSPLFGHADFMKLWIGETISTFGSRMGMVAVSFAAVISLHATPFQMGLLAAAGNVPTLLFSLVAGAWVDRLRRRPLMIGADIGRTILLATIPLATVFGILAMPQLIAVMFAAAVLDLVFDVAYRAYLPSLVADRHLLDANSKLTASEAVAEMGGFGFSGWVVQWLTAPMAVLVDAISFLASALALALVHTREPEPRRRERHERIAREIVDGARHIFHDRRLRALGVMAIAAGFSYSLASTLYMLFVVNALGFEPGVLGMIFAVGGVSSLFGALAARRTAAAFGSGRAMVLGLGIEGLALLLIPLARGNGALAASLLIAHQLLGDGAGTTYIINSVTLIQTVTPKQMLGRVNATMRFLNTSSVLLGELTAGVAGGILGLRTVMVIGAAGVVVSAGILSRSEIGTLNTAPRTKETEESPAVSYS